MPRLELKTVDEFEARRVSWLWPSWLPLGKHVLLDGDPGMGKSLLCLDLAARVSTGGSMPDGSQVARRPVAILSAEDDTAHARVAQ